MFDLSKFDNASFDRGASRGKELLWWVARSLFFAPWFPVPSRLKVVVLRAFGARVGTGVVIRSRVNITFPWKVEIGDYAWIGDEVFILSLDRVTIGRSACLSQRAFLCTGSHDHRSPGFDLITRPIEIAESCWIGAQVFVGPGVSLGPSTICAAGAVVVKSGGPDEVLAGNPARRVEARETEGVGS